jgi:hypothetical protein
MTTRRRRSRWNDPKVWVPLLTAVIASVVGPILVIYYQNLFRPLGPGRGGEVINPPKDGTVNQGPQAGEEESGGQPEIQTPAPNTTGGLGIDVDKPSYVVYETAVFSGSIDKAEEGKTVRIDVYDPRGSVSR